MKTLDSSPSTPLSAKKDSNVNPSPSSHGMELICWKSYGLPQYCPSHSVMPIKILSCYCIYSGSKSQKVPVNKMVRTDASDPSGRLHAYLQAKPVDNLEGNSSLAAVR